MDEMKVIRAAGSEAAVPLKQVSSITPVNGNRPSFTVAQIDPASSRMADYAVYTAANDAGSGAWKRAYDFDATYHQQAFSGAALEAMVAGFHADADGQQAGSLAYERYFDAGFPISPLVLGWPQYVCGMDHMGAKEYKSCACPGK
jgi:sphingomyelin phosphodiesterase acid-like 3